MNAKALTLELLVYATLAALGAVILSGGIESAAFVLLLNVLGRLVLTAVTGIETILDPSLRTEYAQHSARRALLLALPLGAMLTGLVFITNPEPYRILLALTLALIASITLTLHRQPA